MHKVQVTSAGIRRHLKKYQTKHAIAEYIWNGFDANATKVEIIFEKHELGKIFSLQIRDNGDGISHKKLNSKFRPFLESEKEINPNAPRVTSNIHGKNGVGRLTFFTFASSAKWKTVYLDNTKILEYEISISSEGLDDFQPTKPTGTKNQKGTEVTFDGVFKLISYDFEHDIHDYLSREFGWFLELNAGKKELLINGEVFDYSCVVGERDELDFDISNEKFHLRYIRWNQKLNDEFSRYYFLDSTRREKLTDTTTLNHKGDQFYHSIYVESTFFDTFEQTQTQSLFKDTSVGKIYQELIIAVDKYLKEKRKPFLKDNVDKIIDDLEKQDAFPDFGNNEWDKIKEETLKNFIGELYQVEPKIFASLNIEQKKTFVRLLNLVMDSGERDALLEIISQVVKLTQEDRKHLSDSLKITTLSNIIKTIKLIEDRIKVVNNLKELVFKKDLKANERDHLQKVIEKHYWIFGEQYHLVTAEEPKIEEALRRLVYVIRNKQIDGKIDHPDKLAEMDIFMVRRQMIDNKKRIKSVCVELKHPLINLGKKQYSRLEDYRDAILSSDEFNAKNIFLELHLIGNGLDNSGYIEKAFESAKNHGEPFLTHFSGNCKMYVKTWSEVFAEFELRHEFLLEKLELERNQLSSESNSAIEIVHQTIANSAVRPSEITIPR